MHKLFRILLTVVLVVIAAVALTPTVRWYFFTNAETQEEANRPLAEIGEIASVKAAKDVTQLVALAAKEAPLPSNLAYFETLAVQGYESARRKPPAVISSADVVRYIASRSAVVDFSEAHYSDPIIKLKNSKNRALKLGLDLAGGLGVNMQADFALLRDKLGREPNDQEITDAMNAALEIIKNRADQFGATEPVIRRQGQDQILVELPGERDPDAVNRLITGKGSLTFHIANDEMTRTYNDYLAEHPEAIPDRDGKVAVDGLVPPGVIIRGYYKKDRFGVDQFQRWVAIAEEVGMDGAHIKSARTGYSQTGQLEAEFSLDSSGAVIFARLSGDHVNEPLVVLMDNKIKEIANINQAITGGNVSVTGFSAEEANALATILKSASLPVRLDVVGMQTIGPSLGRATIMAGIKALLIGVALVYLFTIGYYTGAGVIACIALTLNLLFQLGMLSFLGFTFTLTSMAGLVLNIGMAVDANVIIYERIREEVRAGKTRRNAVEAGYKKAFWTIMDANVTTLIAAVFLSQLGNGPVKGFAITLAVGIVTTLITGIYISKVFFDIGTENCRRKTLWIGWGVKPK